MASIFSELVVAARKNPDAKTGASYTVVDEETGVQAKYTLAICPTGVIADDGAWVVASRQGLGGVETDGTGRKRVVKGAGAVGDAAGAIMAKLLGYKDAAATKPRGGKADTVDAKGDPVANGHAG